MSIAWKELYAIVISAQSWGLLWQCKKLLVHCNNHAVIDVWRTGTCKSPEIMVLVRMLFFCAADNNFNVCVQYIPGINNIIADAFSFSARSLLDTSAKGQLTPRQHPCLATTSLHRRLMQCRYNGVAQPTRRTYQSGLNAYPSFCSRLTASQFPLHLSLYSSFV